jgi:hypothetical protein
MSRPTALARANVVHSERPTQRQFIEIKQYSNRDKSTFDDGFSSSFAHCVVGRHTSSALSAPLPIRRARFMFAIFDNPHIP